MEHATLSSMAFATGVKYGLILLFAGASLFWCAIKCKWPQRVWDLCTCLMIGVSTFAFLQLVDRIDHMDKVNQRERDLGFYSYELLMFTFLILMGILNVRNRRRK